VVLHKQLQFSTRKNSGIKPKLTGRDTMISLDKSSSSAVIEKLTTGTTIKAPPWRLYDVKCYQGNCELFRLVPSEAFTIKKLPLKGYNISVSKNISDKKFSLQGIEFWIKPPSSQN
jgi:hypothetical protein